MSRSSRGAINRLNPVGVVALLAFALPSYAAESDPVKLLERMSLAAHTLNYEGTFVYAHGNRMQSVRIIHGIDEKGEYERLVTLSGKSREVVRNNDEVTCILPDDKSMQVARGGKHHGLPHISPDKLGQISSHYQLLLKGHERVADREADHLSLTPKDHYRYGHAYWIDRSTGLLLRADLIGEKGQPVEQMMFTSLTLLDSVPRKSLLSETQPRAMVKQRAAGTHQAQQATESGKWEAASLPPGFTLELLRHHPMPGKKMPVEHHVYSDGLASVSVFIEPADNSGKEFAGPSLMGAVHAYARELDGHRIVVVGEVPAATVEEIANTIRTRDGPKP